MRCGADASSRTVELDWPACCGLHGSPKLLDREPCLSNQRAERTFRKALMIRNNEATMGAIALPQDDVTAALTIHVVPEAFEGANRLHPRDRG
jgi:hypothetical protein